MIFYHFLALLIKDHSLRFVPVQGGGLEIIMYQAGSYDIAVIGGGHAGCEAALAAARLGCSVILFTINLDAIANLPCNPRIGGTSKGHLVREIDALGGEMGKVIDQTFLQSRMLNRGKGPAVHSLRAQADRRKYQMEMKKRLEMQPGLCIKQCEITEILFDHQKVTGVVTHLGASFSVKAVIIASGTYLKGNIIVGDVFYSGGPDGMFAATKLSQCLLDQGIELMRFKTGTPARVHRDSLDLSQMEEQKGDDTIVPFSFTTKRELHNKMSCWLTYTNEETHRIIRENIHRSPLYSGKIEGIGPRYCPSIEDKVMRFPDKTRHQIFIEPTGEDTKEMYVQGRSSSLPEDVQLAFLRSVKGMEHVQVMRTGYAIEYDCINPLQLKATLEVKTISGLYGAGQFNGSSGYEEAAAQGLVAGINAARKIKNQTPVVIDRSQGYIGTLIDDLVTKGTKEPYRMMTARSEYRLLLRQDNADARLTPLGYELGLISQERYESFCEKQKLIQEEIKRCEETTLSPTELLNQILSSHGESEVTTGVRLAALIRRPTITYQELKCVDEKRPDLPEDVKEQVNITIKYQGYIEKQKQQVEQFLKMESKKIPEEIDYQSIYGLRLEARQKLSKIRPESLGQASRISGVSSADLAVLMVALNK